MKCLLPRGFLFLLLCFPDSTRAAEDEILAIAGGLSGYNPSLAQVRESLKAAGGGKLRTLDDYWGKTLHFSLAFVKDQKKSRARAREIAYFRYRGRSEPEDYLIELEKYSGSMLIFFRDEGGKFQSYWGSGIDLIRMKIEGAVKSRGAPQTTQKDWLGGISGFTGFDYFLSETVALGVRYTHDFVPATVVNGVEYALSGGYVSYSLSLYWK